MNVACDLRLHRRSTADWQDQPTDEIMIWLNRRGGAGPLGPKCGSVSLGGAMGDLCQGDIGWKACSFVRRADTTGATLNLDAFESGGEVLKGSGRLDTTSCSVDIG